MNFLQPLYTTRDQHSQLKKEASADNYITAAMAYLSLSWRNVSIFCLCLSLHP